MTKAARTAARLMQHVSGRVHQQAAERQILRLIAGGLGVDGGRAARAGGKGVPMGVAGAHQQFFVVKRALLQFDGLFKAAPQRGAHHFEPARRPRR